MTRRDGDAAWPFLAAVVAAALLVTSCTTMIHPEAATRLQQTAGLIEDVKAFGKGLGIEPTEALSRTAGNGPALSMLWLWMQRAGTLALRGPVDIRLAIGYSSENERVKIEQVYRVDGYSVYYRQGSEFADARSVATVGFSDEPIVRRVKVTLHEDLHGDVNFALPWEIEEGIVTPLGSLAAVEYFRWKNEQKDLQNAVTSLGEERVMSQELNALMAQAEKMFGQSDVDTAKEKVLALLGEFPHYQKQFERQIRGQHRATVLEAKLSHDLAYYRYFDAIVGLAEKAPNLQRLIEDLKKMPRDATPALAEKFLQDLSLRYLSAAKIKD